MRYRVIKKVVEYLVIPLIRLEVVNQPDFPKEQGALFAVNHIHALDPILVSYAIYPVWLNHLAKEEAFHYPFLKPILKWLGVIPLKRERPGGDTIKKTLEHLANKKYVCIFPQGTRRKTEFGEIKKGAAKLALNGQVPIYPVALSGLEKVRFWGLFKRPKVRIIFGDPIKVEGREKSKEEIERITTELQEKLKTMYSGIYIS